MPLLAVHNLKKAFVERVLFEGVSFEVSAGDHIGFVGVNGCGKSTLFRILLGEEGADDGDVHVSSGTVIGSMKQSISDDDCSLYEYVLGVFSNIKSIEAELDSINAELTILASKPEIGARLGNAGASVSVYDSGEAFSDGPDEAGTHFGEEIGRWRKLIERQNRLHDLFSDLGGTTYAARTRSTLLGLGFTEAELGRSMQTFSGGQRNKAQLARLLLSNANLLLLDEPTNHLDIGAIEWLEDFLGSYRGSFIVISHDRYFLDRVTNRTIELKDGRVYVSKGNYSRHMELRSTARELEMRQYLRTKKEIQRIEGIVEQQRRWGQERNFITAASKQKQADRLRASLVTPERESASIHFSFTAKETGGNDVLVAKKLAKDFGSGPVFRNVDMLLKKGEKVFLLGDNGCGKTTLLNILSGRLRPSEGSYYLGSHVEAAYYEQTMSSLNPSNTVLNEVWDKYYTTISRKDMCNALAAFLFHGEEVDKPIALLSGGEMARVQLLKLMLTRANLLLLDEPTNHLDIASREALESALEEYDGTMLIVTHDRYLVNRLADRVLHMTPNGLREYIGGYDDYVAALHDQTETETDCKRQQSRNAVEYRERKAQQSAINRAKGEAERCEAAVTKAEAELAAINEELAMPHIASDYVKAGKLAAKADEMHAQIERLYTKWEEAETRLSELCGEDG